jgi:hypothetical protein
MCTGLTLLLLLGARGWWRRDRSGCLAYLLVIATFPVAYYISHPLMDYRQPIEPEIVILVVLGLREVTWRVKARSTQEPGISILDHSYNASNSYAEMQASSPAAEPSATAG